MAHWEYFAELGNGHQENQIFEIDSGESVTCHFKDSGSDTTTDKYFNLHSDAKQVGISVNKVATITHINGVELKYPITLGTDASNTFTRKIRWLEITVRADSDDTVFEIFAN